MPDPLPLDGPGAQVRLLEGVAAVIGAACEGPQPGVVLLDDVHAADEATLDAISYLGHRLRGPGAAAGARLAQRGGAPGSPAPPPGGGPGARRKGRDREPRPARARTRSGSSCRRFSRTPPRPGSSARVYLESEGLPLFVAEYLAALRRGRRRRAQDAAAPEVRGLLEARLGGLGDVARQVLGAAAAIGRSFDLDTVRQASGRSDEETVGALEELVAHGVVREVPGAEPGYDFSHQKLRALVYEQTGLARRRLLHGRVAAAMSARPGGESAALVAQHLRLAGDDAGAAEQLSPRRRARRLAARPRRRARAPRGGAGPRLSRHRRPPRAHRRPAHARGRLRRRARELRERRRRVRAAGAGGDRAQARAACTAGAASGSARRRAWRWRSTPRRPARWRCGRASWPTSPSRCTRPAVPSDAAARAREALELADAAADRHAQAQAHNMLGMLARSRGRPRGRASGARAQPRAGRRAGRRPARAAALNNLALVERDAGELESARELTESALELSAAYGDRHREAALENNLADLHHAAGADRRGDGPPQAGRRDLHRGGRRRGHPPTGDLEARQLVSASAGISHESRRSPSECGRGASLSPRTRL